MTYSQSFKSYIFNLKYPVINHVFMEHKFHFLLFMCTQSYPDIMNRTAALMTMPKGRYQYLKKLIPLLANQSEDCLTLNIYVPGSGKYIFHFFAIFFSFFFFLYEK